MPLNEQVVDAVTAANFKNVAEGPAFYAHLAMGDSVAHQRGINAIREAALGRLIKGLVEEDIGEAIAVNKEATGNDVASQLASLAAVVASIQQQMKGAQSTPPETAVPK